MPVIAGNHGNAGEPAFRRFAGEDERQSLDVQLKYAFNPQTEANGWGTMDPAVWQDQISLYSQLGQFSKRTPKLEEVMTLDILKATRDARIKV